MATSDLYEALIGADYNDPVSQAELAKTLRRMRGRGETAMTAPMFEEIGKMEVEDSAKFAQKLGDNQRMRDIAEENRAARLQGLALSRAAAEEARADKDAFRKQQYEDRMLAQLSAKLQQANMSQVTRAAEGASKTLSKYKDKDLPGVGWFDSWKPDAFIGEEGMDVRSSLAEFANQILRMQSGLAVTDAEYRRFLQGLSSGSFMDEDTFKKQLPNMFRDVEAVRAGIEAGYDPRIRQRYYDEGGQTRYTLTDPFSDAQIENPATRAASVGDPDADLLKALEAEMARRKK